METPSRFSVVMTYADFHLYFTVPLLALVLLINIRNPRFFEKKSWAAAATLLFLAVSYTTPWDSYLIRSKVWSYSEAKVLGTLFLIPFEEYFFFVIQTIIGCLLTMRILKSLPKPVTPYRPTAIDRTAVVVLSALFILPIIYAPLYVGYANPLRYFYLVAAWGAPIVLLQWSLGYRILLRFKWHLFSALIPLTGYLWFADWYAIQKEIWFFPGHQTSGIFLFSNLPIEEALFFLLTNLMVIQGFILFTQFNKKELPVKLGGTPY